jgi:CRP/FNR family transcriptional regulator, cyclic AMP receptor protein
MPQDLVVFLRSLTYFAGLPLPAVAELAGRASERSYARGELVILEGEPPQAAYFVLGGQARVFKLSAEGRIQSLDRLGPGEAFNLVPVFDGQDNPASVEAVNALTLCIISRPVLLEAVRRYPALAEAFLADLAARLRRLAGLVEDLSFRTVRGRLARFLVRQAQEPGRRLTQAEMAAELGTVRDVVGRLLAEFQDEGLISIERHRIMIRDRARLEAQAER